MVAMKLDQALARQLASQDGDLRDFQGCDPGSELWIDQLPESPFSPLKSETVLVSFAARGRNPDLIQGNLFQ